MVDPLEKSRNSGACRFVHPEKGTEFPDRYPALCCSGCFHVLLQQLGDFRMTLHGRRLQKKGEGSSLAPGPVAAAVLVSRTGRRSAAAGVAEFFLGRAFFPVAPAARAVPVLFSTCTGMQGEIVIVVLLWCCVCGLFWHVFTNRTLVVR